VNKTTSPLIPLVDLRRHHASLEAAFAEAIARVSASAQFVGGPEVEGFEAELAAWHGGGHVVAVGNATDALAIILRALGIGPGDAVITTALSFFATAEAIALAGARPVFCDVDPATASLDPARAAACITPRTRAILPVHLYGHVANMDAVTDLAARYGLAVIEDCAQAIGGRHRGVLAGTFGTAAAFSFYPSKNLGAFGDGGAILTRNPALAERCRRLANHGGLHRHEHRVFGTNSRLDALQAAILRLKLPHLAAWNEQRRALAAAYVAGLRGSGVELQQPGDGSAHHLLVVRHQARDALVGALRKRGIGAEIHYPAALPDLEPLRPLVADRADFAHARRHAATCLSLPLFPGMRDDELATVCDAVHELARE
jgi:dTDP-4-amino-4,6-dideoxygalactose transaminase